MNSDGTNPVQLTNLKGFAGVPVYAPNEKHIAFMWRKSNDFADRTKWLICVMDAGGENLKVITNGKANDQVPN
jgi:Tol biopolymer transport system component